MSRRLRIGSSSCSNGTSAWTQNQSTFLYDLPLEILTNVLTFLKLKDWLQLRLVSRTIRESVDHSPVWSRCRLVISGNLYRANRMVQLLRVWNVKSVDISRRHVSPSNLRPMMEATRLKEICLTSATFSHLGMLRSERVFKYDIPTVCIFYDKSRAASDKWHEGTLLLNTRKLCLKNCPMEIDLLIRQLHQYRLTHLDVDFSMTATIVNAYSDSAQFVNILSQFLFNRSSELVYLRMDRFALTGSGSVFGENMPESGLVLETLDVAFDIADIMGESHRYDLFRGCNPERISNLKNLRLRFRLPFQQGNKRVELSRVGIDSNLRLETLKIKLCDGTFCSPEDVLWMSSLPRTLRSFHFDGMVLRMTKFISDLGDNIGKFLSELQLGPDEGLMTKPAIPLLIDKFTALEKLLCRFTDNVGPSSISELRRMKNLRMLEIYGPKAREMVEDIRDTIKGHFLVSVYSYQYGPKQMFP